PVLTDALLQPPLDHWPEATDHADTDPRNCSQDQETGQGQSDLQTVLRGPVMPPGTQVPANVPSDQVIGHPSQGAQKDGAQGAPEKQRAGVVRHLPADRIEPVAIRQLSELLASAAK